MKAAVLAHITFFAMLAGQAEARTIVLPTRTTTNFTIQGGPANTPGNPGVPGSPATLVSFEVESPADATLVFIRSPSREPFGVVAAGQRTRFEPGISLLTTQYGHWFGHLRAEQSPGIGALATWSNVTIELGDEFIAIPEPATWALIISGFMLAGVGARRTKRLAGQI